MSDRVKRQLLTYGLGSFLVFLGLAILIILIVFAGGTPHVPKFSPDLCSGSGECVIGSDPTRQAWYANLERDESDVYILEFEPGETVEMSLIVPQTILSEVRVPAIKMIGPELELVYSDDERTPFANSASVKQWVLVQPVQFEIPETGEYQLVVFDEVGEPGEYALWLNGKDPVNLPDLVQLIIGTIRINW